MSGINKNLVNQDLVRERANATIDVDYMKKFLGELNYLTPEKYQKFLYHRDQLVKKIGPLSQENFYNLDRQEKYDLVYKKTLDLVEYNNENENIEDLMLNYMFGAVLGLEKPTFNLHYTMFRDAIEVWGTQEQYSYWKDFMDKNVVFGTYVQTEIGHGTYLRGLETTATYDASTQEFILDSPTLTSIKFWPGGAGKSCNFAIVMAKLLMDNGQKDCGIHAFIVQLRSTRDHRAVPGIELGDIGRKFGFETTDNGYVKFNKHRIPRFNMLMQFARVSPDGKFERIGNELLMYAAMLLMRGSLPLLASYFLALSTTIAIRYSCVRRQTANMEGEEQQIINYQTQQYRLLPALATSYIHYFSSWSFRSILIDIKNTGNNFKNVDSKQLAKLHALVSGLKAVIYDDCLKFVQSNRLCCGGHGYSAASGLSQLIQEADAGCTYEGDNVVLLLQTARYLLKCAQKGTSPYFQFDSFTQTQTTPTYKYFSKYLELFTKLYDDWMVKITSKLLRLVNEEGVSELNAWNQCSVELIAIARVYIHSFIIYTSIETISKNKSSKNQQTLHDLLETYILYNISENYSSILLTLNILSSDEMTQFKDRLFSLLDIIRKNALVLVDSFDYLDSNLNSALGAYDGNVYERLFEFAKNSKFNENDVHQAYYKYMLPYSIRYKKKAEAKSKL